MNRYDDIIKKIIKQCMKVQQSYMEFLLDDLVFNRGISIDRITLGKEKGNPLVGEIFIDDNEFIKVDFNSLTTPPQYGDIRKYYTKPKVGTPYIRIPPVIGAFGEFQPVFGHYERNQKNISKEEKND